MSALSPAQARSEAEAKALRPVYLLVGAEPYLLSSVLLDLRAAALAGGVPGLNEDQFSAAQHTVDAVLAAARTLPMLAKRRLVVVRDLEQWEPRAKTDAPTRGERAASSAPTTDPLERLLDYAKNPSPTTTLLLVGGNLDKRRRLVTTARNDGFLVSCEPLSRAELGPFIQDRARDQGSRLGADVADLLAELVGPELGPVVDAVDRLTLYAGAGNAVTEAMVTECVVRLGRASVWELVGAVGRRDLARALLALDDVFEPSEGVRLVALLAWSTRQLLRFESAQREGANPAEAAVKAGAPPFKARDLAAQVKGLPRRTLEGWLRTLAAMDRDLKGGSRLASRVVLERGLIDLCRMGRGRSQQAERPVTP